MYVSIFFYLLFFIVYSISFVVKLSPCVSIILFIIKVILFLFIIIFSTSVLWISMINEDEPAAILDSEGIWIKEFGFIEWNYISKIDTYRYRDNVLLESIAIDVDKNFPLSRQATWSGKMRIFWSKLFGYPAILISSITIPNHEVIEFAQQFIK